MQLTVLGVPGTGAQTPPPPSSLPCGQADALLAARANTAAQDAYSTLLRGQPDLACARSAMAMTGAAMAMTRAAMAMRALLGAEALADRGLPEDAAKALGDALKSYPDQITETANTAVIADLQQPVADPFALAVALLEAGFNADAINEFKAAIKGHPADFQRRVGDLPHQSPEFLALLRAVRSESSNTLSWWQLVRQHALPWLRTVGEVLAVAVGLLVLCALIARLARFLIRKPLLIGQFTEAPDLKLGSGLVALMGGAMASLASDVPGTNLRLVNEFDNIVSVSADVASALPAGRYVGAAVGAITSLLPGGGWTVTGYQHERGERGAGLSLSLTTRSRAVLGEVTLWEKDYVAEYQPGGAPSDHSPYWLLAIPAAAWVLYQIRDEDQTSGFVHVWERAKEIVTGRFPTIPLTTHWRSYALFAAGVGRHKEGDIAGATELYKRSLIVDHSNQGALSNLASCEIDGRKYATAWVRLERLTGLIEEDPNYRRNPLWFGTQYTKGVALLAAPVGTLPRPPGAATALLVDMLAELEGRLLHPRGRFSKVRTWFRRPAKRQDAILQRELEDFEAPALVVLAEALLRDNHDQAAALPAVTSREDLLARLRSARSDPLDGPRARFLSEQIVAYVERNAGRNISQVKYSLACFYAQRIPIEVENAFRRLADAIAHDATLVAQALNDPSLDPLRQNHRQRFDALVPVPEPPQPPPDLFEIAMARYRQWRTSLATPPRRG